MKMEIWRIVCSRADFIQIHWAKQRPLATAIVHDCTLDSRVKMKRGCRFDSGEGLALVRNFTGLCVSGLSKLDLCRTVLCFIFYLMSVSMSVFVNTKGMSNVYIDLDSVIKLPAERHENAPESWNAFEALPSAIDDLTVDERETMMKSSSCDWSGVTWPKVVVLPVYGTKPSFFCLVINFLGSGCRVLMWNLLCLILCDWHEAFDSDKTISNCAAWSWEDFNDRKDCRWSRRERHGAERSHNGGIIADRRKESQLSVPPFILLQLSSNRQQER